MSEPFLHFRRHCDNCLSLGPYQTDTPMGLGLFDRRKYDLYIHSEFRGLADDDLYVLATYANGSWDYDARRVEECQSAAGFENLRPPLREALRRASIKNLLPAGVFVSWESQP